MSWIFFAALAALLLAMILVYLLRRDRLEINRLRHEADIEQSSPHSIDEWRDQAEISMRRSHARRGIIEEEV